jgi:hypothetical protein
VYVVSEHPNFCGSDRLCKIHRFVREEWVLFSLLRTAMTALLSTGVVLAGQAQDTEDPEALFQRIKARVAQHLTQLPNYTCHQTVERLVRTRTTNFQHMDTVELEVAFIGQQELFARPGEDRFGEEPIERLVKGGTMSSTAMGSPIDIIFSQDVAEFKFAGYGKKDGRKTIRYNLRVPVEKSTFRVRHDGKAGMAGYEGSVWVDAETLDLVRVDFKVNRIPSFLGVQLIEESMHYKKLTIGNSEFDLPDKSELAATDSQGTYTLNMINLTACHEYGANSIVKFASPSEGTASRDKQ